MGPNSIAKSPIAGSFTARFSPQKTAVMLPDRLVLSTLWRGGFAN